MALLEKELEVRPSTIANAGQGLFAKSGITKGTRMVEYKGEVKSWDQARLDPTNGYIYFLKPNYVIDARNFPKSLARYANDARGLVRSKDKDNNAVFEADGLRVFLVAAKDISPGDEIFVSYGPAYWQTVRLNQRLKK